MKLDEAMALSDEELRIKAAMLTGWKQVGILNDGVPYGVPPADWKSPDDPFPADRENVWVLPDYPNDIAAAWELCNAKGPDVVLHTFNRFAVGDEATFVRFSGTRVIGTYTAQGGGGPISARSKSAARAITRAFVLAMTQEEDVKIEA